ncbi:glucosylglycerol 3-phosphatase [Prochlorococcus sp. MIT 1223]|uniref:glucosylglycerol 3-phosphatase n=1 Tax=Prochlorococcus sp. MIT 1223 TaxID=3096217 RepID=UPI002A760F2B|nr:glucosylglycerol 3-phosphatase [Prochlorococcus sp. MIT 1223]
MVLSDDDFMSKLINIKNTVESIINENEILIIQDIDGVCIPLVKDPLNRRIDHSYIYSVSNLKGEFYVLTCGEHEGERGVNRIIEKSIGSKTEATKKGLYLPGLAGCGVEYQNNFGEISLLGISNEEIDFLKNVPSKMKKYLTKELSKIFPNIEPIKIKKLIDVAVCDTRFTPTINFNEILNIAEGKLNLQIELQQLMKRIMEKIINSTKGTSLEKSFSLHLMPNLGKVDNVEIMKGAKTHDIGTTDIQFIINGAVKESGLLVLLNQYIFNKSGRYPFGSSFNVREAPKSEEDLINLCLNRIKPDEMPMLIGVGDTVTSTWNKELNMWQRGGSDRGFLSLIQELGRKYNKENKILFVSSGNNEVPRPKVNSTDLTGVTDKNDNLRFNSVLTGGPAEYIKWFNIIARERSKKLDKNIKFR